MTSIPENQSIERLILSSRGSVCAGLLVLFSLLSMAGSASALIEKDPLRLIKIISSDDQGAEIGYPHALHFDRFSKEIYVVSSSNRITVYDNRYFPVISFGKGRGLVDPRGVTVDEKGNIYVCNGREGAQISSRITIFNPAFFKTREIVFAEIAGLENFQGNEIAVSAAGNIYVVGDDIRNEPPGILVLDNNGAFLRWLKPVDFVWRQFKGKKKDEEYPVFLKDIAIDKNGRIYVVSPEVSRIFVYNEKEELLFKFGEKGGVRRKLSTPVSLAVDPGRQVIYVVDYMRHTILCYDYRTGKYVFEFGGRGTAPLWFNYPNRIEVDDRGRVLVSDLHNRRVQVIDPSQAIGNFQASLPSPRLAEAVQPPPAEKPAEVSEVPPQVVAPATIVDPGQLAAIKVGVPAPPAQLAGPDVTFALPAQATETPFSKVPEAPVVQQSRQIMAKRMKKKVRRPPAPTLPPAMIAPAKGPGQVAPPAEVKAVPVLDARGSGKSQGWRAKMRSLPAALAVYGPVASLVGIGSWLLYTNP